MIQEHIGYEESTIDHLPEICFEVKESWLIENKKLIYIIHYSIKA